MKKTLMILGVLAALSMVFVGCDQPTTTEDATGGSSSTPTTSGASATPTDDSTATDTGSGVADTTTGSGAQTSGDSSSSGGDTGAAAEVVLLNEAADLNWDPGVNVSADKFSTATNDSKIVITYTSNDDDDYHTFKMADTYVTQEFFEGTEENFTIDRTSTNPDSLHGCSFTNEPSATEATISYKPSASEWTLIKEKGFKIYGHGAKVTKITLK